MTELRDQFAMAALTGLMRFTDTELTDHHVFAEAAYLLADAMLVARAPQREPLVDDLDLSVRAANLLQSMGVRTIAQLRNIKRKDLVKAGGSVKTINEIFKTSWEAGP